MTEERETGKGTEVFDSPYRIVPGMEVIPAPGNVTAGVKQILRLNSRGELWPAGIAILNFLYEFKYLTAELLDRAFRSISPEDRGYNSLPRFSAGKGRKPFRRMLDKYVEYGLVNRCIIVAGGRRTYVYCLAGGAREWMCTMEASGGLFRHPLYLDDGIKLSSVPAGDRVPLGELMRCLSLAQAAISIRTAYRGFGVHIRTLGGCDTIVVESGGNGEKKALLIHAAEASEAGVNECAAFLKAIGKEHDMERWAGPERFSLAILTDGEAGAASVLHPGLMRTSRNVYFGLSVMYLFDFVTFYGERPLDSLHFYPGEETSVFELRSWPV